MKWVLGSRKSDLARVQAYATGRLLQKLQKNLEIEYHFRSSLGDQNFQDPLWKMPEKGVFTEDFTELLLNEEVDLVVHSWKDLPVEIHPDTEIVATLPRADQRDLLFVKKETWEKAKKTGCFRVLSSSPRRQHQSQKNLAAFLPVENPDSLEIQCQDIRGNLPTRLKKLFDNPEAHALLLAKAGVDRLLGAPEEEFKKTQAFVRRCLDRCRMMLLPLSVFPSAAAQGALAIQIKKDREELRSLLHSCSSEEDRKRVESERKILKSFGGGCHQKIGISVVEHPKLGEQRFLNGTTDEGRTLCDEDAWSESGSSKDLEFFSSLKEEKDLWPRDPKKEALFDRQKLQVEPEELSNSYLWVSRANALPDLSDYSDFEIWSSGVKTWQSLARRGLWVVGTADCFGEEASMDHPSFRSWSVSCWGPPQKIVKLSHEKAPESSGTKVLATYKLIEKKDLEFLRGKSYYFWMSGSTFEAAVRRHPDILQARHASGPGHTEDTIRKHLGSTSRYKSFIGYENWLKLALKSLENR